MIPTVGGEPVRLAPTGRDPRLSPDGQWIAYWRGAYQSSPVTGVASGNIYVVPAAGGRERRLGSDLKNDVAMPVWAPDSKQLLVLGRSGSSIDWWLAYLDGRPSRPTGILKALNEQGVFQFGFDRIPHISEWARGFILLSAPSGHAYNVWRLPISDDGHSTGRAERLTSGTTLEVSPICGSLIFASLNLVRSIWGVSADVDGGAVRGDLKRITDGRFELRPSISRDGRMLAFAAASRGAMTRTPAQNVKPFMFPSPQHSSNLEIRVKDLETGREAVIAGGEPFPFAPKISGDGSGGARNSTRNC